MRSRPRHHSPTQGSLMSSPVVRGCAFAAAALLTLSSCHDSPTASAADGRALTDLHLLHVTYDYPQLATREVSFWAVKGRAGGADLWYHARAGASDSAKFAEFRVAASALDRRPDGTAIAMGDSVLITLTATDASHMRIAFQPSGLHFASGSLPTLKIFWVACGDDVNYDGSVDAVDDAIISQFGIWRQETDGAPWFRLPSVVVKGNKETDTELEGFSGYLLAY
jgi:hypothetical protein